MPWELLKIPLALPVFVLVLGRVSGLMLTAPIFSSRSIPNRVKVTLTLAIAWVLYPVVAAGAPADISVFNAVGGMFGELLVGVTIGLAVAVVLAGVQIGGLIVGQQAGMALARVFDPTTNSSTNSVGQIYTIVVLTMFVIIGGHRAIVAALLDTFDVIPLMSFAFTDSLVLLLVEMITAAFILAIRLAGPALIALSLVTLAMGLLTRTMPQMNILSVGFNVRVLVMMASAGLAIVASQDVMLDMIMDAVDTVRIELSSVPG